ncbi:MAG TPA: XdhC family protein [Candidatus Binatia bacterium]|nr:XdhC family protein [Candidatus Binatia bacterium]
MSGPGPAAILRRAAELSAAGRPFALATVVAVVRPTSARPGARGIVHPDGKIEGWVGGSCAQPIVVKEALRSLVDGQPRLLRISKEPPSATRRADGVIDYVMTCHSGGTLEIAVEPVLPAPELWVAGTTPIAAALVSLGAAAGFRVTVVDPVADPADFPAAERVQRAPHFRGLEAARPPYVVVASQGVWDEEAVEAALRLEVAYLGLVASPTRAAAVRAYLREVEVPEERIAALRAPAGLDIGAETPEEIALSILAELVQVRRGRAPFVAAPGPATVAAATTGAPVALEPAGADAIVRVDPVCGMEVERDRARHLAEYDGVVYAFCSLMCRTRFVRDPAGFLARGPVGMGGEGPAGGRTEPSGGGGDAVPNATTATPSAAERVPSPPRPSRPSRRPPKG